jgi:hypothetical protein
MTRPTACILRFGRRTRPVLAGALAAWIFLLGLVAVSPAWHDALHGPSAAGGCAGCCGHHAPPADPAAPVGDPEHRCAITTFAQGITSIEVAVVVAPPAAPIPPATLPATSHEVGFVRGLLPPGRAPPAELTHL